MVMSDLNKMMLFMFLGLIVAIMMLGFSRSPKASPSTGLVERTRVRTPSRQPASPTSPETYPSNERAY